MEIGMDEITKAELERVHDEEVRQNHRLDIVEHKVEQLNEIALSIKELTINMSHMVEAQKQMSADLEEIKSKPASMWEKAVAAAVSALIAGVVGYWLGSFLI